MQQNKDNAGINPEILLELVNTKMLFGKYQGHLLCDLPEPYLAWLQRKGFPPGKIGALLSMMYEIKFNGLQYLLKPLRK
ncbi:MAG: DUF3820 family protein [Dehalococcoidales bacterium]|nr:DUF3820 family protein [Dehalococcoidales bacterium]